MLNRRALLSLLLLLVLGAFAWGTVHLFQLRFAVEYIAELDALVARIRLCRL